MTKTSKKIGVALLTIPLLKRYMCTKQRKPMREKHSV